MAKATEHTYKIVKIWLTRNSPSQPYFWNVYVNSSMAMGTAFLLFGNDKTETWIVSRNTIDWDDKNTLQRKKNFERLLEVHGGHLHGHLIECIWKMTWALQICPLISPLQLCSCSHVKCHNRIFLLPLPWRHCCSNETLDYLQSTGIISFI